MWGTCYVNAPLARVRALTGNARRSGSRCEARYVVRDSPGKLFHIASAARLRLPPVPDVAERAVLDQDHGEPGELAAHEHREALDAPRPHVRAVMEQSAEQRDRREERAVVGGEHAVAQEEAAREAPEDPRAEPSGDDRNEDRGARTGSAEEARGGSDGDAEKQERGDGRERPARQAAECSRPTRRLSIATD